MAGKLIIFSAPSGAGKTTLIKELLKRFSNFEFSISATSRAPRGAEQSGVDYYFMSNDEFKLRVEKDEFVEWEEVYAGTCYGTLRAEVERIWANGNVILFDVDVLGGIRLKEIFGQAACSIFVMPPSIEVLRSRLVGRATDAPEVIEKRVSKAEFEISKAPEFDNVVINDDLSEAVAQAESVIRNFLK